MPAADVPRRAESAATLQWRLPAAVYLLGVVGLLLLPIYRRHPHLPAIAAAQACLSVAFNRLALEYFWLSRETGPAFLAGL